MSPDTDGISLDELFAAVGVSSPSSSDGSSPSQRKAERETTEEDLLGALGISPTRVVREDTPASTSVDAAGIDKQDRREEQKNRARQWREELKQAEALDADAAAAVPASSSPVDAPVQASITSLPDASGAIRPFSSDEGTGRIGALEQASAKMPDAPQVSAGASDQAAQGMRAAPAGAMPAPGGQQGIAATQPGAPQRVFHPWQPQSGMLGQMQPMPGTGVQASSQMSAPQPAAQQPVVQQPVQQASAVRQGAQPGSNQPLFGQSIALSAHPQQQASQSLQPLQSADAVQAEEPQQLPVPAQMAQPHPFQGMAEVGSLRPIEQQLAKDAANDQMQGVAQSAASDLGAASTFQASPVSMQSAQQPLAQLSQQGAASTFASPNEGSARVEQPFLQGTTSSEQVDRVVPENTSEGLPSSTPGTPGSSVVTSAPSEGQRPTPADAAPAHEAAQLVIPDGTASVPAEHAPASLASKPPAPAMPPQSPSASGPFVQSEPAPPLLAVSPQPERGEALDDLEKEAKSSKAAHIVGGILIAIALVCVVVAVCLLTGIVDLSTFNPSRTPASPQETSQLSGQAAPSATSSGSSSADDPAMTTQSGSKSGEVVYSYVVRGVDGGTHEAMETATFGDDGKLISSVLEIQSDSQEDSEKLLEQLKQEFGESLTEGTASEDKLVCTVVLPRDDLDRDSYTELLSTNAPEFKIISS